MICGCIHLNAINLEQLSGTVEQGGRTQMQNFKFNKGFFQNSKSQQRWRKTHKEKTKLYKKNLGRNLGNNQRTTRSIR